MISSRTTNTNPNCYEEQERNDCSMKNVLYTAAFNENVNRVCRENEIIMGDDNMDNELLINLLLAQYEDDQEFLCIITKAKFVYGEGAKMAKSPCEIRKLKKILHMIDNVEDLLCDILTMEIIMINDSEFRNDNNIDCLLEREKIIENMVDEICCMDQTLDQTLA